MWIINQKFLLLLILGMLLSANITVAQESEPAQEALEPPPLPPKIRNEEEPPVVSIRTEEDKTIEEYRQNGKLYMVKITPKEGKSYYYMDLDGDGNLELQDDGFNQAAPAMWKLKEW